MLILRLQLYSFKLAGRLSCREFEGSWQFVTLCCTNTYHGSSPKFNRGGILTFALIGILMQ